MSAPVVPDRRAASDRVSASRLLVLAGGAIVAIVAALLTFVALARPPRADFLTMSAILVVTAVVSVSVGAVAYQLGLLRRAPKLVWALMGGYLLAAALTFVDVLVTERLMFLSEHDLLMSTVLLVFAAIIATSLGYLLSATVATAVSRLNRAVGQVAAGNLDVEVVADGPEEIAALARSFNEMTGRLRQAERERGEVATARRDLLTAVGHDLRTPLASVRVILEALADDVVDDAETRARYLRTARGELASLSRLVDDLFMLAQLDSGGVELERQQNSISDLISDTLESFAVRAELQRVTLRGEPCGGDDTAAFDARYVGRALANLVENALHYTPSGGEVVLRSDVVPEGVSVAVSDTGPGIAQADLPRVFERFYRGEESRNRATGGSGLGLAIVKGVVEAHGGRVGVEALPGRGTTFSFVLPA